MASISAIISFKNQQENGRESSSVKNTLGKIAEEYISENGGVSLGSIETPSFIRKISNVSLKPQKGSLKRVMTVSPDKKILKLLTVLGENELPLVG